MRGRSVLGSLGPFMTGLLHFVDLGKDMQHSMDGKETVHQ